MTKKYKLNHYELVDERRFTVTIDDQKCIFFCMQTKVGDKVLYPYIYFYGLIFFRYLNSISLLVLKNRSERTMIDNSRDSSIELNRTIFYCSNCITCVIGTRHWSKTFKLRSRTGLANSNCLS